MPALCTAAEGLYQVVLYTTAEVEIVLRPDERAAVGRLHHLCHRHSAFAQPGTDGVDQLGSHACVVRALCYKERAAHRLAFEARGKETVQAGVVLNITDSPNPACLDRRPGGRKCCEFAGDVRW